MSPRKEKVTLTPENAHIEFLGMMGLSTLTPSPPYDQEQRLLIPDVMRRLTDISQNELERLIKWNMLEEQAASQLPEFDDLLFTPAFFQKKRRQLINHARFYVGGKLRYAEALPEGSIANRLGMHFRGDVGFLPEHTLHQILTVVPDIGRRDTMMYQEDPSEVAITDQLQQLEGTLPYVLFLDAALEHDVHGVDRWHLAHMADVVHYGNSLGMSSIDEVQQWIVENPEVIRSDVLGNFNTNEWQVKSLLGFASNFVMKVLGNS